MILIGTSLSYAITLYMYVLVARAILSLSIDLVRWFTPRGSHSAEEIARLHADLAVRMTAPRQD